MISHVHRCIFVHIPKTGGTSIEDAIWGTDHTLRTSDMLWMGGDDPHYKPYVQGFGPLQHLRATDIETLVGPATFNSYFRFTIVRNPWDRLVSQYHHLSASENGHRLYDLPAGATFEAYLERLAAGSHERHCQSIEQWRFVFDDAGRQLVDSVGRFENLTHDYEQIAARLGVTTALGHQMQSSHREPTSQYFQDPAALRYADAVYGEDIERFAYRFPAD